MDNVNIKHVDKYVIIYNNDNEYLGKNIAKIWNNNGMIVKLDNDRNYIDKTIKQYNLINGNKNGYMLVNANYKLQNVNKNNLANLIYKEVDKQSFESINNEIQQKFNVFMNTLINKNVQPQHNNTTIQQINNTLQHGGDENENNNETILQWQNVSQINLPSNMKYFAKNTQKPNEKILLYQTQDMTNNNYLLYIKKYINEIFSLENIDFIDEYDEYTPDGNVKEFIGKAEKDDTINKNTFKAILQPVIIKHLKEFKQMEESLYFNIKNSVIYKEAITDKFDLIPLGKQLINIVKQILDKIQENITFENGEPILDKINIFSFIRFKIINGYIVLENKENDHPDKKLRINEKLFGDFKLVLLKEYYDKPLNNNFLINMVTNSMSKMNDPLNQQLFTESIKILSQEYCICIQPKPELLLWCIQRLILCWFADLYLYKNIYNIKILINMYKARGDKELNKDLNVEPVIVIIPRYGKKIAIEVIAKLNYYFFTYKNVGWINSHPSFFEKKDELLYYTNGSLKLKKYVKYLVSQGENIVNPLTNDFKRINLEDTKIEHDVLNPFATVQQIIDDERVDIFPQTIN